MPVYVVGYIARCGRSSNGLRTPRLVATGALGQAGAIDSRLDRRLREIEWLEGGLAEKKHGGTEVPPPPKPKAKSPKPALFDLVPRERLFRLHEVLHLPFELEFLG